MYKRQVDEQTWDRIYQSYIGVEDLITKDTTLFPVDLEKSHPLEVTRAMPQAEYGLSTRQTQSSGQNLTLNSSDI